MSFVIDLRGALRKKVSNEVQGWFCGKEIKFWYRSNDGGFKTIVVSKQELVDYVLSKGVIKEGE